MWKAPGSLQDGTASTQGTGTVGSSDPGMLRVTVKVMTHKALKKLSRPHVGQSEAQQDHGRCVCLFRNCKFCVPAAHENIRILAVLGREWSIDFQQLATWTGVVDSPVAAPASPKSSQSLTLRSPRFGASTSVLAFSNAFFPLFLSCLVWVVHLGVGCPVRCCLSPLRRSPQVPLYGDVSVVTESSAPDVLR